MNPNVSALMQKARRALSSASRNLAEGDVETAANRTYYAVFHAAQAGLLSEGLAPKTHAGVHDQFRKRFITTGRITPEQAHVLFESFRVRLGSDYGSDVLAEPEEVGELLPQAERFVEHLERLLGRARL